MDKYAGMDEGDVIEELYHEAQVVKDRIKNPRTFEDVMAFEKRFLEMMKCERLSLLLPWWLDPL